MIDNDLATCFTLHQLGKSPLSGMQGVQWSSIEIDGTEGKEAQRKVKNGERNRAEDGLFEFLVIKSNRGVG